MAKYATNVSGAILLPSSIQATESIFGSVVPLAMFFQPFVQLNAKLSQNIGHWDIGRWEFGHLMFGVWTYGRSEFKPSDFGLQTSGVRTFGLVHFRLCEFSDIQGSEVCGPFSDFVVRTFWVSF